MAEPLTKTEKAWVTRDRVFRVTRVHHGTQRCIYGWEVTQDHVHVALARDLSEARAVIAKVRHAERKATLDQLIEWSEAHPNAPVRLSTRPGDTHTGHITFSHRWTEGEEQHEIHVRNSRRTGASQRRPIREKHLGADYPRLEVAGPGGRYRPFIETLDEEAA